MDVELSSNDEISKTPYWLVCEGRSEVTLSVRWKRPSHHRKDATPPFCRLSYLTAPGLILGSLISRITLGPEIDEQEAEDDEEDEDGAPRKESDTYHGTQTFPAPYFHPLRIRVELVSTEPVRHRILHVIPKSSVWVSRAILALLPAAIAVIFWPLIEALRITPVGWSLIFGVVAAVWISSYLLRRFRHALPFFGIGHLIYRSATAFVVGLVGVSMLVQSSVFVVHNDTGRSIDFDLGGRSVAVVPGSTVALVSLSKDGLHEQLDDVVQGALVLCTSDAADGDLACRDSSQRAPVSMFGRMRAFFTPQTMRVGCGRRWGGGVRGTKVLPTGHEGIEVDDDQVWLTAEPEAKRTVDDEGSHCGRTEPATAWYGEHEDAAHRVRYPWSPARLKELGRLWLTTVPDHYSNTVRVTLRSKGPEGADTIETRIRLSGSVERSGGWPLAGLPTGGEQTFELDINESLPELSGRLDESDARLACKRGDNRGVRATRLGLTGPMGWLEELKVKVSRSPSWTSTWHLVSVSNLDVATPWVCEGLPRETPDTHRTAFPAELVTLRLDPSTTRMKRALSINAPTALMSQRIQIVRETTKGDAKGPLLVGELECMLPNQEPNALITVGRLRLDDRREGQIQGLRIRKEDDSILLGQWTPTSEAPKTEVWMCWPWRPDERDAEIEVIPVDAEGNGGTPIQGSWKIGSGHVALDPKKKTVCYRDKSRGRVGRRPPADVPKNSLRRVLGWDLEQAREHDSDLRKCQVLYDYERQSQ